MLEFDLNKRVDAQEALKHPWFKGRHSAAPAH
jgi:hypothetical protein